jgi:hypothetical protein
VIPEFVSGGGVPQKQLRRISSGLIFLVFCGGLAASAREPVVASERVSDADGGMVQATAEDISPLPIQLTDEQAKAPQLLSSGVPSSTRSVRCMYNGFYQSAHNHPLTPKQVSIREAVYGFRGNTHQFVHVELKDGKVLTGTVAEANDQNFQLKTGILSAFKTITYSQLAETPRAVPAVGTRVLHTLKWTGLVIAIVPAIPLGVLLIPLFLLGVFQD